MHQGEKVLALTGIYCSEAEPDGALLTVVFRSNRIVTCHSPKNIRNISYVTMSQGRKSPADRAGAPDAIKNCYFELFLIANQLC